MTALLTKGRKRRILNVLYAHDPDLTLVPQLKLVRTTIKLNDTNLQIMRYCRYGEVSDDETHQIYPLIDPAAEQ